MTNSPEKQDILDRIETLKHKPNKHNLWLFGIITVFCLVMAGINHKLEVNNLKQWQDKNSATVKIQVDKNDKTSAAEILQLVIKRLEKMKMTNVTTSVDGNVITITVGGVTEKKRLQQFIATRAKSVIGTLNSDDIAVLTNAGKTEFFNIKTKKNVSYTELINYSKIIVPSENLSFSASINKTKTGYEIPVSVTPRTKAGEFSRYLAEHQGEYLLYFVDDVILSVQEITPTTIDAMIPMPRSDGISKNAQEEQRIKTIAQAVQLLYPYPAEITLLSTN